MSSCGILRLPNELLKCIQDYLNLEDRLELRQTCKRFYIVCHASINTIFIHNNCKFPEDLRAAGFNGKNFQPIKIHFKGNVILQEGFSDFLKEFGSKCETLKFDADPDFVMHLQILPFLPNLKNIDSKLQEMPMHLDNEEAEQVFVKLESVDFLLFTQFCYSGKYGFRPTVPDLMKNMTNFKNIKVPDQWVECHAMELLDVIRQNATTLRCLETPYICEEFLDGLCTMPNLRLKYLNAFGEKGEDSLPICLDESKMIAFLGQQSELERLAIEIAEGWSQKILDAIGTSCKSLKGLTIKRANNEPFNWSFIRSLKNLQNLDLWSTTRQSCDEGNHFTGLEDNISRLTKLSLVNMHEETCNDCMYSLVKAFPKIQQLHAHAQHFDERSIKALFTYPNLTSVRLSDCPLVKFDEPWLNIKFLSFFGISLDIFSIKTLPQMPNLKILHFHSSQVFEKQLIEFIGNCPQLTELKFVDWDLIHIEAVFDIISLQVPELTYFFFRNECEREIDFTWTNISGLQNLKELRVPKYNVNENMLRLLFEKMPKLKLVHRCSNEEKYRNTGEICRRATFEMNYRKFADKETNE